MRGETVSAIAQILEVRTETALERLNEAIIKEEPVADLFERYASAVRMEDDFDQWRKDHEGESTREA